MADILQMLVQRPRPTRMGVVTEVLSGAVVTVAVAGGVTDAKLMDHTAGTTVGSTVVLLPIGDGATWAVIGSMSAGGAGGPSLGSNLVPNPGFEFGLPGSMPTQWDSFWTNGPAVTEWSGTPGAPHSGDGVAEVTLTPTASGVATYCRSTPVILDAGINYRASSWLRASAATSNNAMAVVVFSAPTAAGAQPFGTGAAQATMATVSLPGAAWQEIYGTFTLPAGHVYASLFLLTTADAGADLQTWWDDAAIRQIIAT